MSEPTPNWQPISFLPMLAEMIGGMLESAEDNYQNLQQSKGRPHVLEDGLIERVIGSYTQQLEDHWLYEEQLAQWRSETLSQIERREVERLQGQSTRLKDVLQAILVLAHDFQSHLSEPIAGSGPEEEGPSLSEDNHRLASDLDQHVNQILADGGGDEDLLVSMAAHMGTFKQLLDRCTSGEMNQLCDQYPGFFRFAKLLEQLAQGIADGAIPVPPEM